VTRGRCRSAERVVLRGCSVLVMLPILGQDGREIRHDVQVDCLKEIFL